MHVLNVHEREFRSSPDRVGALIDTLASPGDQLWPKHIWPRMWFDRPLGVGASGGHGPIRYVVDEYTPQQSIVFRFTGPPGFDGFHRLDVENGQSGGAILRHTIQMKATGIATISWPVVIRPLHDALVEDAFTTADVALGEEPKTVPWSFWVRFLRFLSTRGKARAQCLPANG